MSHMVATRPAGGVDGSPAKKDAVSGTWKAVYVTSTITTRSHSSLPGRYGMMIALGEMHRSRGSFHLGRSSPQSRFFAFRLGCSRSMCATCSVVALALGLCGVHSTEGRPEAALLRGDGESGR